MFEVFGETFAALRKQRGRVTVVCWGARGYVFAVDVKRRFFGSRSTVGVRREGGQNSDGGYRRGKAVAGRR